MKITQRIGHAPIGAADNKTSAQDADALWQEADDACERKEYAKARARFEQAAQNKPPKHVQTGQKT